MPPEHTTTESRKPGFFEQIVDWFSNLLSGILSFFGFGNKTNTPAPTVVTPSAVQAEPRLAATLKEERSIAQPEVKTIAPTQPVKPLKIYTVGENSVASILTNGWLQEHAKQNAELAKRQGFIDSIPALYTVQPGQDPQVVRNVAAEQVAAFHALPSVKPVEQSITMDDFFKARLASVKISENSRIIPDSIFRQNTAGQIAINVPSEGVVRVERVEENVVMPGESTKYRVTVYPTDLPNVNGEIFAAFKPAYVELTREQLEKQTAFVLPSVGNRDDGNAIRISGNKKDNLTLNVISEGAAVKNSGLRVAGQRDYQDIMGERAKALATAETAVREVRKAAYEKEQALLDQKRLNRLEQIKKEATLRDEINAIYDRGQQRAQNFNNGNNSNTITVGVTGRYSSANVDSHDKSPNIPGKGAGTTAPIRQV